LKVIPFERPVIRTDALREYHRPGPGDYRKPEAGGDDEQRHGDAERRMSFISKPLLTTRAITVAAPGYLSHAGTPRTPEDLRQHACLHYIHPTTRESYPWLFKGDRRAVGRRLTSPLMVSHPDAMRDAAIAGL
jgi:hypothetical protein